jgi:NAD(P)-dependent dehydrogenase (short-subunit alcohol dehydrogenase family)
VDRADCPADFATAVDVEWVRGDVAMQETWDRVKAASFRRDPKGARYLIACAAEVVVAPFLDTPPQEWRRLFDVNVMGVVRALHTLLPAMIARGKGAAAVTCSVNSLYAEDQLSAYSVSKAALLHVVRSAALEYASHGIRINAVCPGTVETPMLHRHLNSLHDPAAARRAVEKRTPTGKIVQPEEVAAVLRFAVSDEASGLSGATLIVDGGLTTSYDFNSERVV